MDDKDLDAANSSDDESPEETQPSKKGGRRRINIEFIEDKSRRHITFSKRKAGIMKKVRVCVRACVCACACARPNAI